MSCAILTAVFIVALTRNADAKSCHDWPNTCPGTLPRMKQTWQMNKSTIIMPCNNTGFTDPKSTLGWGIVDFDWSNAKGTGTVDGWAKHKPMDDEELLMEQVKMTTAATPGTTVWVYRNTVYGYPWYTAVRQILEDPEYEAWFLKFKPRGPWFSSKCDNNYNPPLCSDYYHSQEQSPGYPHGDGDCVAPACDCGKVPCGFYVWNHSSTAVVKGQTFQDWFIHSYMLNSVGSSALVSGFFWDDVWNPECNIHDQVRDTCEDMGLTKTDLEQLTASYLANMAALRNATIAAGKFAWQMLWTGGVADNIGSTGPRPIVQKNGCAKTLRELCTPDSPAQTRAMMYGFNTGDPASLPELKQDLANFLLVRGPYAWLGHGWKGCSRNYFFPPELNEDYGEPHGLCTETAPGSEIFRREWSKASVEMDCTSWTPRITLKREHTEDVVV
mmetsp:Transcript_894/g.2044  ORF Transcript_894/g.2044 Transcript_894/m.2044 type:complete len:441 (-) Transcript_894:36-1358(-)